MARCLERARMCRARARTVPHALCAAPPDRRRALKGARTLPAAPDSLPSRALFADARVLGCRACGRGKRRGLDGEEGGARWRLWHRRNARGLLYPPPCSAPQPIECTRLRQILHRCHRPAGPLRAADGGSCSAAVAGPCMALARRPRPHLRLGCSSSGGIDAARLVRLRGVARAAMRRPPRRALVIVVPPPPGPGLPRAPGDARRRVALSVAPEVRLGGDAPECAAARARLGHQVLVLGHALDRQLVRLNLGLRLELSRRLRVADPG